MGAVLGFLLKPRGRPLPIGEHFAVDPAFSAFGWPDEPVVFKFQAYSRDDEPEGRYTATADGSTKCVIAGRVVTLDQLLEHIGEQHDDVRLVAETSGVLAVIELDTDDARDG